MSCARCGAVIGRQSKRYCSKQCASLHRFPSLAARFWAKVQIRGADECWPWKASKNASGYGQITCRNRPRLAHRVAWENMCGEIPDGLFVCHRCDNPACVNQSHLYIGTAADNARDASIKGRMSRPRRKKPYTPGPEKRCPSCGEVRPMDAFHLNRRRRDGRAVYCKSCMSVAASEWYTQRHQQETA